MRGTARAVALMLMLIPLTAHAKGTPIRLREGFAIPLVAIGDTVFCYAEDGGTGGELWKSDGTSAGTVLVKDVRPGPGGSLSLDSPFMTNVDGTLFFSADDGSTGRELWRSDGTPGGTVRVADLVPGPDGSYPVELTSANGRLFFRSYFGDQLWTSDGTATGTVPLSPMVSFFNPQWLTAAGDLLFFRASPYGSDLWRTDGTDAGTVRLFGDFSRRVGGSGGRSMVDVEGTLFFFFNDFDALGGYKFVLAKSDGSAGGTVPVKDILPATATFEWSPVHLTNVDGTLFAGALHGSRGYTLFRSDGTPGGTALVKDISGDTHYIDPYNRWEYYVPPVGVNGTLFFVAYDEALGIELWKSDGTAAGTVVVKDIRPGREGSLPAQLTNVNGMLFFSANDGSTGRELWRSDGTPAGTELVADLLPGELGSVEPFPLVNGNGRLFFTAADTPYPQDVGLWTLTTCGDGVLDAGEACDDGNRADGDCCSAACTQIFNGAACDDGNPCTTGDVCLDAVCCGGGCPAAPAGTSCSDGNPCTDDACDAGGVCRGVPNTASCEDVDRCTEGDTCAGGACIRGPQRSCEDGQPCTVDTCDSGRGCVHRLVWLPEMRSMLASGLVSDTCAGQRLPAAIGNVFEQARTLLTRAAGTPKRARARHLMRKGIKRLKAGQAAIRRAKGRLSGDCAGALAARLEAARHTAACVFVQL